MIKERWEKIEEIFYAAIALPIVEREKFVAEQCGYDPALISEINHLLSEDGSDRQDRIFDLNLFSAGAKVINVDDELIGGQNFSLYKIQKLLGRGGMGSVYLAEDLRLNRLVALKVLLVALNEHSDTIERFQLEARAASQIAHHNIAHIYEFGEFDGRHFLAMEYVRGQTLRELITSGLITEKLALDYFSQITAAIAAAHQSGIIHRDIKPENIIVTNAGLVKILDFGLAKFSDRVALSDRYHSLETNPGLIIGTTAYMSPEQIRGQSIGPGTDIWSLGVIFYEMLCGKRPFTGQTPSDVRAAILKNEVPVFMNKLRSRHAFRKIIIKCLEKDVRDRFQNISQLLQNLDRIRSSENNQLKNLLTYQGGRHRIAKIILSVLSLSLILMGLTLFLPKSFFAGSPSSAVSVESVAVMPFIETGENPEEEFLIDGLTESLIARLSEISGLKVKSRNSVFLFKDQQYTPRSAGEQLGVQAVLIGRVTEHGDDVILDLELVDTKTEDRIWGNRYMCHRSEEFSLQSNIIRDISHKLRNTLSRADQQKIDKKYTESNEASQLYHRGRYHWNKRTGKDLQKSVEYFNQAIAIDPNYALAYAGLADSYVLYSGFAAGSPDESFPKAEAAARKALKLDETLAEAHTSLAYALFNYDWNFEESEREFRRALELNPNYALAYQWYANANLISAGRSEEAILTSRRAVDLDPLSFITNADLGTAYLYAGKYDEAVRQYQKTLELNENYSYALTYLGRTYLMKGDYDQAVIELNKSRQAADDPRIDMLLARLYILKGDRTKAFQTISEFDKPSKTVYISPYYYALIYAGLGDRDKAFEWLEKAFQKHEGRMTLMKADPLLQNLQSDARFDDLLKRVGLKK